MIQLPNTPVRQRIGLDDNRYGFFTDQLRAKGFRSLGYRNGHKDGDENDTLIKFTPDFCEIYNTGSGFHIYVSESAKLLYLVDSGD